jgi:hypothetical protein
MHGAMRILCHVFGEITLHRSEYRRIEVANIEVVYIEVANIEENDFHHAQGDKYVQKK